MEGVIYLTKGTAATVIPQNKRITDNNTYAWNLKGICRLSVRTIPMIAKIPESIWKSKMGFS